MNKARTPESIKEALSALADGELLSDAGELAEDELIEIGCNDPEVRASWQSMHLVRDVLQADYHSALSPDFSARVSAAVAQEQSIAQDRAPIASLAEARGRREQQTESQPQARIRGAQPARRRAVAATQSMQQPFSMWKPVAGLGLAASLAGAAFLLPQLWQPNGQPDGLPDGLAGSAQVAQVNAPSTTNTTAPAQTIQGTALEELTLQVSAGTSNNGTRWRMESEAVGNEEIEKRLNTLLTNHLEDASMGRVHGLVSHSRVVGYDSEPDEQ